MVAWAITNFGGMIPRTADRLLPESMAADAWNCDLSSGILEGMPVPLPVADLTAVPGTVGRAYRVPGPTESDPDLWLPLVSPYSSVCRSPLANDSAHRLYWTNPGDGAWWMTYEMLRDGIPPWRLGIAQPDTSAPGLAALTYGGTNAVAGSTGGTTPVIARSYCYTFVNAFGEESAPCVPSAVTDGASDGLWNVYMLPTTPPANPKYHDFPPVVGVNLYRTTTGSTTGADFYLIYSFVYGVNDPPAQWTDTVADTTAIGNQTLQSASWANPLDGLDGLTQMPGGMLVGFTGNTVHFCEPDRPHAWPASYDLSLQYEIVGLGVWQGSLVVMTKGFPSTGQGTTPASFVFTPVNVPEPCVSRGSIITDLLGVYYASQNGLVMLNYYGMQNQTQATITKNIWQTTFDCADIIACRHRNQYLAVTRNGMGFLLDYTEPRMGVVRLNTGLAMQSLWADPYSGDAYFISNKIVYLWDSPFSGHLIYRWLSKEFYGTKPISLAACQVELDPFVEQDLGPLPYNNNLPGFQDPGLQLPPGVNAVFNLYAGPDRLHKVFSYNLTKTREIFRLPAGFLAFSWQVEVIARVGVRGIEIATSMHELKTV